MTDQAHRELLEETIRKKILWAQTTSFPEEVSSSDLARAALDALTTGPVFEAIVERACMANINPLSEPSDTERRIMTAALRAALGATGMGDR